MTLNPDKLMIVAHPDDESLWGGANLIINKGWKVMVATNGRNKERSLEFYKAMLEAGVWEVQMFNQKDSEDEDKNYIAEGRFKKALEKEAKKRWSLVLTHNNRGEYGHIQHIQVHELVKKIFRKNLRFFKICEKRVPKKIIDQNRNIIKHYTSQNITHLLHTKQDRLLREIERKHFTHECLYSKIEKVKIPKIIHQIWIGKKMPKFKKIFMNSNKKILENKGWKYKLWKNKDINIKMLPFTFQYIQTAFAVGKQFNLVHTKWAQVSDLMRYEIMYRYGGVYIDTNVEILKDITNLINQANKKGYLFIGANEDFCGLKCKTKHGKFLTNGFFACVPNSDVLGNLISPKLLNTIDFTDVWVNRQTGPFYLRKGIKDPIKQKVFLLDTSDVYPFVPWDTLTRTASKNLCILSKKSNKKEKKVMIKDQEVYLKVPCDKYPDSLMMNHFVGGSWDWS